MKALVGKIKGKRLFDKIEKKGVYTKEASLVRQKKDMAPLVVT